jgi:hypothetical protein
LIAAWSVDFLLAFFRRFRLVRFVQFVCSLLVASCCASTGFVGHAAACDKCRRFGVQLHSESAAGGDASDDALTDSTGGSASFVASGSKWPQPGGLGSQVTLTYSFENMFDGGLLMPNGQPLPNSLIRGSIEEALGLWAGVAPLNFVEVADNGLGYGIAGATYGQIRFRHKYINGPDPPPPALPVAKAQAYFPGAGTLSGDVEYDHGDRWQEVGELPRPDILGATIHELGHSLGLSHTDLPEANMYWIFTRYSGLGTGQLHADDVAGIRSIYGTGVGSVTSLVPEPCSLMLAMAFAVAALAPHRTRRTGYNNSSNL